eukprot:8800176-Heterocapsa_arctica.AAC.1
MVLEGLCIGVVRRRSWAGWERSSFVVSEASGDQGFPLRGCRCLGCGERDVAGRRGCPIWCRASGGMIRGLGGCCLPAFLGEW